jgi:hypothetical protein
LFLGLGAYGAPPLRILKLHIDQKEAALCGASACLGSGVAQEFAQWDDEGNRGPFLGASFVDE